MSAADPGHHHDALHVFRAAAPGYVLRHPAGDAALGAPLRLHPSAAASHWCLELDIVKPGPTANVMALARAHTGPSWVMAGIAV